VAGEKSMKITHPYVICWRGIVGIGFAAGVVYRILQRAYPLNFRLI
jgi:hypothetical protein